MTISRRDVDGGWAWVVLCGSFMNLMLASGIGFVSGIFQKVFLEEFEQSVALTAWVTALFSSLMQIAGPFSGLLATASNCRVSVMVGGALFTLGLAASSLATSLRFLFVSFGLVAGMGLGLVYSPSIVVVNYYFDRRRTVIMGLALSASGVGIIGAPVLSRFLIDAFTWQEALVILASLAAHTCVFGALMFPLHEPASRISPLLRRCRQKLCLKHCKYREERGGDDNQAASVEKSLLTDTEFADPGPCDEEEITCADEAACSHRQNESGVKGSDSGVARREREDSSGRNHFLVGRTAESPSNDQTAQSQDHIPQGTLRNGSLTDSLPSIGLPITDEVVVLPAVGRLTETEEEKAVSNCAIFKNVPFLWLCLNLALSNAGCGIFGIHLPAFSQQRGLDDHDITFILAMNGVALFVSRILVGALGHDRKVDQLMVYFGLYLISSVVQMTLPLATSLWSVTMMVMMMGIYYGSVYSLVTSLTICVVGLPRLAFAFSVEMVCAGIGYLVAPPLAGWIVDKTGDYNNSMYLGGALMLVSALVLLPMSCGRGEGSPPIGYEPPQDDTT